MSDLWGREPALVLGAVQALLVLLVAFGLRLSPEQTGAILALSAAVLAVVTRQNVSPARGDAPEHDHAEEGDPWG